MLEQVCPAELAGTLVPRAHVVPEVHRSQRDAVVWTHHYSQPVAQGALVDRVGQSVGHCLIEPHRARRP
ncbi:hypothetical protein SDC9_197812 [bioreactor metagenome]|uniref:Uncharacterized protein n=1 Tax=bioreactor metagenome TaxID=1076179 RepID=A0A645IGS9_9ZZZZ